MQQISNAEIAEIKSRIDQIQEMLATGVGAQPITIGQQDRIDAVNDDSRAPSPRLVDQISYNIHVRRTRKSHFGSNLLSDATWDMLLDLMLAATNGRELSASDLATGADVPLSSGLRMIATLEQLELAERYTDKRDRRRSIVRLTDAGSTSMASYFTKIGQAWQDRDRRPT